MDVTTESRALRKPGKQIESVEVKRMIRELTLAAEASMRGSDHEVAIPPHVNHFADGMYARELFMPAGLIITSKIHKTNHFCFVLTGKAEVIDENTGAQLVEAPCMIKTMAGTKRVLKILEDSIWITVHATEDTNVDEIEKQIISKNHLDLLENLA